MVYRYWLASQIIAQFEMQTEAFPEGTLKRELSDELMDLIESEYFAGALYELCLATFKSTVKIYLADQLNKSLDQKRIRSANRLQVPVAAEQNPDQPPEEPRIAVVQMTTIFYQLQNSELIQGLIANDIKKTMKIGDQNDSSNQNQHLRVYEVVDVDVDAQAEQAAKVHEEVNVR